MIVRINRERTRYPIEGSLGLANGRKGDCTQIGGSRLIWMHCQLALRPLKTPLCGPPHCLVLPQGPIHRDGENQALVVVRLDLSGAFEQRGRLLKFSSDARWARGPVLPHPGGRGGPGRGPEAGLEMALTGDVVDAATAAEWGLVNRCVPDDELDAAVADLLGRATRGGRRSKGLGKQAFYAQVGRPQADAYGLAIEVMAAATQTPDAQEGVAAFLEKRRPELS